MKRKAREGKSGFLQYYQRERTDIEMEIKTGMTYVNVFSALIETVGYDAQCALLEVRLTAEGRVCRYREVPEEIWYCFRENASPDVYYRRYICGCFPEG